MHGQDIHRFVRPGAVSGENIFKINIVFHGLSLDGAAVVASMIKTVASGGIYTGSVVTRQGICGLGGQLFLGKPTGIQEIFNHILSDAKQDRAKSDGWEEIFPPAWF
jgi:hypothetical protein